MVCTGIEHSLQYIFKSLDYNDYLIKKLKPLCRSVYDVLIFEDRFNSKQKGREFFDVCSYRRYIQQKEWYTYEEFCRDYFSCPKTALERLSLTEVLDWQFKEFNKRLANSEFTLEEFYNMILKNKKLNMYRVLRKICEF